MKLKSLILAASFTCLTSTATQAQEVLSGDTKLACEAILCLATGTVPSECAPSLRRYFSISFRWWSDTLRGRTNFLNLCPTANADTSMKSLTNAMAAGAGRCDPAALNSTNLGYTGGWDDLFVFIRPELPDYCTTLISNAYTNYGGAAPKYVGNPMQGGYWTTTAAWPQEQAAYEAKLAAQAAARQAAQNSGY